MEHHCHSAHSSTIAYKINFTLGHSAIILTQYYFTEFLMEVDFGWLLSLMLQSLKPTTLKLPLAFPRFLKQLSIHTRSLSQSSFLPIPIELLLHTKTLVLFAGSKAPISGVSPTLLGSRIMRLVPSVTSRSICGLLLLLVLEVDTLRDPAVLAPSVVVRMNVSASVRSTISSNVGKSCVFHCELLVVGPCRLYPRYSASWSSFNMIVYR
ncbi:uncharacterized protein BDR25DRAFT_362343 [Lindgomyces ingoldianus]|uniref:Uncharacterized protein n=1 Tax=Lindgomyces ingoldianus TaxID=673940 RepID=A0ACB6QAC3_9PLEO|nr:uncharacterized protein BDR25DRAFT_362343 [Lindgomyces ingoldianus]KAF2463909.1 hypothetical protein BDR25DRAFT_362343 [Lindgomyces ingoldianus]